MIVELASIDSGETCVIIFHIFLLCLLKHIFGLVYTQYVCADNALPRMEYTAVNFQSTRGLTEIGPQVM